MSCKESVVEKGREEEETERERERHIGDRILFEGGDKTKGDDAGALAKALLGGGDVRLLLWAIFAFLPWSCDILNGLRSEEVLLMGENGNLSWALPLCSPFCVWSFSAACIIPSFGKREICDEKWPQFNGILPRTVYRIVPALKKQISLRK